MEGEQLGLYMKFQDFKDFNLYIKNNNFSNKIISLNTGPSKKMDGI